LVLSINPALAKGLSIFMFISMKVAVFISALLATSALGLTQHAKVTWVTAAKSLNEGNPIHTIIKMKVDDGWHTYWKNPGEGGIPTVIEATLPDGWTLGEIQYPAPKRYLTGELPSIGYEGEVVFPVTIFPPKDTQGKLPEIKATLSWLTCNESSCLPGEAEMTLSSTGDVTAIQAAYLTIPKPLDGAQLEFLATKQEVSLILTLPEKLKIDPSSYEVFPVTPDLISAASELRFKLSENKPNTWIAIGKSSEYIDVSIKSLSLELFKSGEASWSISSGK
jgi:DsbC/DsbD-like thiol-disulfide interchange protein